MTSNEQVKTIPVNDSATRPEGAEASLEHPGSLSHSETAQTSSRPTSQNKPRGLLARALSKQNRDVAFKFFTAYGQTWIGLSPVWLMGEALTPGTKVGTQFRKGKANLMGAAAEIRTAVSTSSEDIIVIVDSKLKAGKTEAGKTAEVIKAAGENVIVVVSTSIEKAQAQLRQANTEYGPKIRKSVSSHGRDVIVVLDKALKNPLVITGVAKFGKSKGIPHADALLRLGSLALAKILKALPEENLEGMESVVEEIDAAELERTSTSEETERAMEIGKHGDGEAPKIAKTSRESRANGTTCDIM